MESLNRLLDIMATLRDPEAGCPWDREQDFSTIAPYTIEEAYEVADAIQRGDRAGLCSELGDLLFQVVYHARMAEEEGSFDFLDVVERLNEKLVQRHPHVFNQGEETAFTGEKYAWERHKLKERETRAGEYKPSRVLEGISLNLPALHRAQKLQTRAASVGFDWDSIDPVLEKLEEELHEVKELLAAGNDRQRRQEELGDLLFACVNLARHLEIDAEAALRSANHKFERRFHFIETQLRKEGESPESSSLEYMDALWESAKKLD